MLSYHLLRVNLTLNRDKDDFDESPDELVEEIETRNPTSQQFPAKTTSKAKAATRSRSVLGCDQVGIETLVSMQNSSGSDSEKEEPQNVQAPVPKTEAPRVRANMLRKTGRRIVDEIKRHSIIFESFQCRFKMKTHFRSKCSRIRLVVEDT